jgi:1,4-dihydroxy-2-naphthoate octaprenyltransferase
MSERKKLLGPMRPPFLVLPPVCVFLGMGTAIWRQGRVEILHVILVFFGSVAAHVSVNALNEYSDFRSSLDSRTQRTPFSGGSGTLQANPELARAALATGLVAMAIAALVGIYFLVEWGLALLPLGLLGLVVVFAYTDWITRYPLFCLIAPGLGFGVFMVMGSDFCLAGDYSWTGFFASLVPFFLVSNLLLLNQFPDVEADESVGRRHYPITLGRKASSLIYIAFLLGTFLSIIAGVVLGYLPAWSLLGLLALVLAVPTGLGAYRYAEDLEKLIPYLGFNVLLNIITPLLVGVGLLIA